MSPRVQLAVLAVFALFLTAAAVWIVFRGRPTPEVRERRRRLHLHQYGRLGDATITEISDALIHYTYSVHGVSYTTSQDVSALRDSLPADPNRAIGVASLKYSPKNPANSIVLCEEWSGLRFAPPDTQPDAKLA